MRDWTFGEMDLWELNDEGTGYRSGSKGVSVEGLGVFPEIRGIGNVN
jgi:hypothetical protein